MVKPIKVLNLYAGIGGNRKLWTNVEVTAVELNPEVAKIYQDFFPNDKVVVGDAHQYLLEHYEEFDFIWSSPPCPTHSKLRKGFVGTRCGGKAVYPDMKLYEEILFLQGYFKGKWVVENVISWYIPLIKPFEIGRHHYWSNYIITKTKENNGEINITGGDNPLSDEEQIEKLSKDFGFNLTKYDFSNIRKRTMLRNCVNPNSSLHIFNMAFKEKQKTLMP